MLYFLQIIFSIIKIWNKHFLIVKHLYQCYILFEEFCSIVHILNIFNLMDFLSWIFYEIIC